MISLFIFDYFRTIFGQLQPKQRPNLFSICWKSIIGNRNFYETTKQQYLEKVAQQFLANLKNGIIPHSYSHCGSFAYYNCPTQTLRGIHVPGRLSPGGKHFDWTSLPVDWQNDREIAIEAAALGFVEWKIVIDKFKGSTPPVSELHIAIVLYRILCRLSDEIARRLVTIMLPAIHRSLIWNRFPNLQSDRQFWREMLLHEDSGLERFFHLDAPMALKTDYDFMLDICLEKPWMVERLHTNFLRNHDFFRAVFRKHPGVSPLFARGVQRANKRLIFDKLETSKHSFSVCSTRRDVLEANVPPEFFDNLVYRRRWIESCGSFVFPRHLAMDRDTWLLFAKHNPSALNRAPLELLSNKELMLQMLDVNADVYMHVSGRVPKAVELYPTPLLFKFRDVRALKIWDDIEVRVAASRTWPKSVANENIGKDIVDHINARLTEDKAFVTFLLGILQATDDCDLPLLNLGQNFLRKIAEYIDAPKGSALGRLRNAFRGRPTKSSVKISNTWLDQWDSIPAPVLALLFAAEMSALTRMSISVVISLAAAKANAVELMMSAGAWLCMRFFELGPIQFLVAACILAVASLHRLSCKTP